MIIVRINNEIDRKEFSNVNHLLKYDLLQILNMHRLIHQNILKKISQLAFL